jgi:hypothetical protein
MSQDKTQEPKPDIHTTTAQELKVSNIHSETSRGDSQEPKVSNIQSSGEDTNVAKLSTLTSALQHDTNVEHTSEKEPCVLVPMFEVGSDTVLDSLSNLSITSEKDSNAVITNTIGDSGAIGQEPEYIAKKYLVGLDGTEESSWAFNSAVGQMDKSRDILYLLSISGRKINDEKVSKKILLHHALIAERHRVLNIKLILGLYKEVPQAISQIANDLKVNFLLLGHKRNANIFQRIVNPSITKHCLSTVNCSLNVANDPVDLPDQEKYIMGVPEEDITELIQKKLTFNNKNYLVDVLME